MSRNGFQPDYRNLVDVLHNRRPKRLPLYEHHIDAPFIAKYLNEDVSIQGTKQVDYDAYYKKIINFWKDMTFNVNIYVNEILYFDYKQGVLVGTITKTDSYSTSKKLDFSDISKNRVEVFLLKEFQKDKHQIFEKFQIDREPQSSFNW